MEIIPVDPDGPAEPGLYFGSLIVPDGGFVGRQDGIPQMVFDYGNEAIQLGGTNLLDVGRMTITGTAGIGLDMSGGTFASAVQNWPADPIIQSAGTQILHSDTTNLNLFIGDDVFQNNSTPGIDNIGLGYRAGYNNDTTGASTEGEQNVYIGALAGFGSISTNTGTANVAIGKEAMWSNTSGKSCMALGFRALYRNEDGFDNMAIGKSCLFSNVGGDRNAAIGTNALFNNISGGANVAIGHATLADNTGSNNIALGRNAGGNKVAGNENILIGTSAMGSGVGTKADNCVIGTLAALVATTANRNAIYGHESARLLTSGDDNIFLGHHAGYNQTTNSDLLIIDNEDRGSAAAEITDCLIYGVFHATPASQTLRLNIGNLYLGNPTHSDADGGGAIVQSFIREDGAGTASTAATITTSHDGAVANDQLAKWVLGVNTGAGVVDALEVDSGLNVTATKTKLTAIGGVAVLLTNTTGANTVAGQLVKADTATDDAVILTAAGDDECFGVFLDSGVADDAEAWVVVAGIADVAMEDNTAATHGNWVETSDAEAGYADATSATPAAAPAHFEEIGHCIESVAAGGGGTHILARCILHFN